MPLQVIVGLVFLVVTAAVMGIFVLISRRSSSVDKTLEKRLSEATGITSQAVADATLLRTEPTGPLPNIERAARRALVAGRSPRL